MLSSVPSGVVSQIKFFAVNILEAGDHHCPLYIYGTYIIVTLYCSRCFYLFPSSPAVFSCSYLASLRSATGEKYSREKLINWKRFVFVEDWLQSLQVAFFPVRVPSARRVALDVSSSFHLLSRVFRRLHASTVLICPRAIRKLVLLHSIHTGCSVKNLLNLKYKLEHRRLGKGSPLTIPFLVVLSIRIHQKPKICVLHP